MSKEFIYLGENPKSLKFVKSVRNCGKFDTLLDIKEASSGSALSWFLGAKMS
jgi:hypothetical protein